ncbi:MAG: transcription antitermination factor NusB [Burkholderiales bacterium]|nr:transcription antitermination factor NusB [Burkholderiales bacterium]
MSDLPKPNATDVATASANANPRPKSARRWAREFAVQALYEWLVAGHETASIRLRTEGETDFKRCDRDFYRDLWAGVTAEADGLTAMIQPHVDRPLPQISPIERSIVLIGAWELHHRLDIPYRVVINESVELAKTFGGTDGHKWVNGVLDKLAPTLRADEVAARVIRPR